MENKLDHSTKFDMWWWSSLPEIRHTADFLLGKIFKSNDCKFKKGKLKNHLKVILVNLHVAHGWNTKLYVALSLDKNKYKMSQRYRKLYLDYRYMVFVVRYLTENGYLEYHRGVNYGHFQRVTRIKPTQKLLRLFRKYRAIGGVTIRRTLPIILRNEDKRDIDFDPNTLELKTAIRNVNRINNNLGRHTIDVDIQKPDLFAKFREEYRLVSGMTKYTRVFNNSDFGQGGRFYGHWSQNIKSHFRKFIRIDGNETVELDYSCLHLFMLFCKEGLMPPEGDLYELKGIYEGYFRTYIKKSVNIAINADNRTSALRAIGEEYREYYKLYGFYPPRPTELLDALAATYPQLEKYLCSGAGVFLQNLDSSIAEKIMLALAERNICCLCVHDSFIVAKEYKSTLYELMITCFKETFGVIPRVKVSN